MDMNTSAESGSRRPRLLALRTARFLALAGLAATLAACSGGDSSDSPTATPAETATVASTLTTGGNLTPVSASTQLNQTPTKAAATALAGSTAPTTSQTAAATGTTAAASSTPTTKATTSAATATPTKPAATATAVPPTSTSVPPTPTEVPPTPTEVPPTPTEKPAPSPVTIYVNDPVNFSPKIASVPAGTTVTWIWGDTELFHDVTSSSFPSDPEGPKKNGSYSFTFDVPGSYPYYCQVHSVARPPMTGSIEVTP